MNIKNLQYYMQEVKKSPLFLLNVPPEFQTKEMNLLAVKGNVQALKYVDNICEDVYIAALDQDGGVPIIDELYDFGFISDELVDRVSLILKVREEKIKLKEKVDKL